MQGFITAGKCSKHTCLLDNLLKRETNLKFPVWFAPHLNKQEENSKVKSRDNL